MLVVLLTKFRNTVKKKYIEIKKLMTGHYKVLQTIPRIWSKDRIILHDVKHRGSQSNNGAKLLANLFKGERNTGMLT